MALTTGFKGYGDWSQSIDFHLFHQIEDGINIARLPERFKKLPNKINKL